MIATIKAWKGCTYLFSTINLLSVMDMYDDFVLSFFTIFYHHDGIQNKGWKKKYFYQIPTIKTWYINRQLSEKGK